jgi:DNA-binding NtrC family response regulator
MAIVHGDFAGRGRTSQSILLISQYAEDWEQFQEFLMELPCKLETAPSWLTAARVLKRGHFSVVISEAQLPDATWEHVLSSLIYLEGPPRLIVISRLADDRLWAEVLNRCGFDVLAKPLARDEVVRVVGHALDRCEPLRAARGAGRGECVRAAGGN